MSITLYPLHPSMVSPNRETICTRRSLPPGDFFMLLHLYSPRLLDQTWAADCSKTKMDTPRRFPSGACSQLDAPGKPSSVPRLVSDPFLLTGALDQTLPRGRLFLCPCCCQHDEEQTLPAPYPSHIDGSSNAEDAKRRPQGPCLGLHAVGFTVPGLSPTRRCALTAPFHPYL